MNITLGADYSGGAIPTTLGPGDTGDVVRGFQHTLRAMGWTRSGLDALNRASDPEIVVTGVMDAATVFAVKYIQRVIQPPLTINGVIDVNFMQRLIGYDGWVKQLVSNPYKAWAGYLYFHMMNYENGKFLTLWNSFSTEALGIGKAAYEAMRQGMSPGVGVGSIPTLSIAPVITTPKPAPVITQAPAMNVITPPAAQVTNTASAPVTSSTVADAPVPVTLAVSGSKLSFGVIAGLGILAVLAFKALK